jgi:hypothetical protein
VPEVWRPFPLEDRIRTVIVDPQAYPLWAQQAAVALTIIEQPRSIPVNNPAGIMCQGLRFEPMPESTSGGWGWGRGAWNRAGVRPNGYALLHEGLTGQHPPFLAFATISDSMRFVVQQCYEDGVDKYDGDDYCIRWFGISIDHVMYATSRDLFNTKLAFVRSKWPSDVQIAGWRDAGASA